MKTDLTPTIEIYNESIFVDGVKTQDPTLIGLAMIDFSKNNNTIFQKIAITQNDVVLTQKSDYAVEEINEMLI